MKTCSTAPASRQSAATGGVGSGAAPEVKPPVSADWREAGAVEHVFTHFSLTLTVRVARVEAAGDYQWLGFEAARAALPTVFAKALDRAGEPALI